MTTPQDYDRLSAYLDNQLSLAEKAKLEARLNREPELKAMLEDLRMTVRALRALPVVKPPRHFTLTLAQARVSALPRRVLFPVLRLATALAALAFVVVVAGDFATNLAGPVAAPASVAEKSAPPTEAGGTEVVVPQAAPVATQAPAESVGATASSADTTTGTGTPAAAALVAPMPTAAPGGAAPPESPPTAAAAATVEGSAGARASIVPTETPTVEAETTSTYYAVTSTAGEAQSATPGSSPLRYVEAGLALLTLLLALAAWVWRAR